jgi:methylthioribose-1-phosphate isomerase
MRIEGAHHRSIGLWEDGWAVKVLDQRLLPWEVRWVRLETLDHACAAIADMWVRGAPLIGITAAYGLALALREDASDAALEAASARLSATRPTAINLRWALDRMRAALDPLAPGLRVAAAYARAGELGDEDEALCAAIGGHGLEVLRTLAATRPPGSVLNILTHCNAGWLATVDWGTALAPIYRAHDAGLKLHVWVDETRPRNQGALLTAFELASHGVPHTVISDNAGGLLMQRGQVDAVIVGTDRVAANGDVCNKVGTYLKALAAHDTGVPFYVALPYSTFDPACPDGASIPIEERSGTEQSTLTGPVLEPDLGLEPGRPPRQATVRLTGSPVANPAFDITPARLISAYITERGVGGLEVLRG